MKAIINTKLILEDGIIFDGAIVFDNDKIIDFGESDKVVIPADAEIIDANGLYTAPGFIDIHNHGSMDYLFVKEPLKCAEHFLKHGETTVLPTIYYDMNLEQMLEGADKIKKASKEGAGKIILGLYMEGPYMSGFGSNQKFIRWNGDIKEEEFTPLVDTLGDFVKVWAIAPERVGIENFLGYVRERYPSVVFALGHTRATAEQIRKVRKYNITLQTHTQDSGKAKGLAQGVMGAGADEYTLYNPDMYAELICDQTGIHVCADLIKMIVRTKGVERMILITDSMTKSGDYTNCVEDGIGYGPDINYDYRGYVSGSRLTLDSAVRNMMRHTGYGLCHAVRFATLNPAKVLGIDERYGSIEKGKIPNLLIMDDAVNIKKIFLNGEQVNL
ncbi:MAG: amidohydrolase family protein [Clostridia bacterium]|nr:amidohydrolase family protein [Clostridia bacterium]